MMNPFSPKHPASPKHFANREDIIEQFRKSIINSAHSKPPKPDNIAILGDWAIGKTSLLNKFNDIAFSKNMIRNIGVFSVKIGLSPTVCKNQDSFVEKIVSELKNGYFSEAKIKDKIKKQLFSWKVDSFGTTGMKVKKVEERDLRRCLIDFWKRFLKPNKIDIALIMLDDVHYMLGDYPEGLYDLRTVFQNIIEDGCNYMLIITGTKNLFTEIREVAEPFIRFFDAYYLDVFDIEGTEEAITKPIEVEKIQVTFDREFIKEIHRIAGGHPYFINFIMKDILDIINSGNVTKKWFGTVSHKLFKHLNSAKFKLDLERATDNEKKILYKMVKGPDIVRPVDLSKKSPPTQLLKRLVEKGLVIKKERGRYQLFHPLFKRYMKEQRF